MEFQKVKNVDASRGSFTHVVGNQYNITTNHTTAIHSAPSSHPQFLPALPVNNDGQVSVPIELQYRGKPTISGEILLDVKTGLGNLNDEEADVNEAVRIKLGVSADHYVGIELAQPNPEVRITDDHSCYDAQSQSGLCISSTQTLAEYFKEYRSYHKLLERKLSSSSRFHEYDNHESRVEVGRASFKFHRTLRIPDDADEYLLPPGLGTFPLVPASKYSQTIPSSVKARGGFLMPMFQREALWIQFCGEGRRNKWCAIKISVGGINVITGLPRDKHPPNSCQDYIAYHQQPWLDGICVSPGVVRQFVAMPLGHGYTIEEQVTGQTTGQATGQANRLEGGIQIDVFPLLTESVRFCSGLQDSDGKDFSLLHTPKDLGFHVGDQIVMTTLKSPPLTCLEEYIKRISGRPTLHAVAYSRTIQLFIKPTRGSTITLYTPYRQTVLALKCELEKRTGVLPEYQCLMYGSEALEDGLTLFDYRITNESIILLIQDLGGGGGRGRTLDGNYPSPSITLMGIAAGGKISQKIYEDCLSVDLYDEEEVQRLWIHVVSSDAWETITGVVPPMSPIVPGTYEKYDYPWYKIYDENSTAISGTDNFIPVKSVHDIDNIRFVHKHPGLVSLNPDTPPPCTSHSESTSVCVFRPCNHSACTACLGMAMVGNPECPICSAVILKFVGFKKPIAKVHAVSGEPEDKEWAVEQRIVGVRADEDADNVITLFLAEDAVSGFHGSASIE